jgi:hypothetical protein
VSLFCALAEPATTTSAASSSEEEARIAAELPLRSEERQRVWRRPGVCAGREVRSKDERDVRAG